jgi:dephospho-CoA kinase|tara:strand:+ start:26 stop:586 length:561 start_codon:yes stop_codon:yes gene_type:complete
LTYYIIGLTGRNASGKGTVASLLMKRSFSYHSLSDTLRTKLAEKGIEESRDNLIAIGNKLREEGGPGVLAAMMREKIVTPSDHVVDSIRNPYEVSSLRRKYDNHSFCLIAVDAKPEVRYERLSERNRKGDSRTWEQFLEQEKLEESSDNPNKQQLFATINEADYVLDNSGNLEYLENNLQNIIDNL